MTKIRDGRQILLDLTAIRDAVVQAGHDCIELSIQPKAIEDTGRDLFHIGRQLETLIALLEPKLERAERRAMPHELQELEQRLLAVEAQIAQLANERRGVVPFPDRKQERG